MDAISQYKDNAKKGWSSFAATEVATGSVAPKLVRFAGIQSGARVLDVACGTGVVALTAARLGAKVTGVDLTPKLLEHAKENMSLMNLEIDWHEGDVEALPFREAQFDVVVSQFGHMFAPRPSVAVKEMLRVLKPQGTLAFSTWPPEVYTGRFFSLMSKYGPPLSAEISPPTEWGDPKIVKERLGDAVEQLVFDRGLMIFPSLSVQHQRSFMERNIGPMRMVIENLEAKAPQKLAAFRSECEALLSLYFEDNHLRQDFLMTRAVKK